MKLIADYIMFNRIAHTYMAAEALEIAAKDIRMEHQG